MKKNFNFKTISLILILVLSVNIYCPAGQATLKAGFAKVDITPPAGVWLSGYAARKKPSDEKVAPVNAPRWWPKSWLAINSPETEAQSTGIKCSRRRGLRA